MVWVFICISIVLLFIVCLFLRIYANIDYIFGKQSESLSLKVKILGIVVFKKQMSLSKFNPEPFLEKVTEEGDEENSKEPVHNLLERWENWKKNIKQLLQLKSAIFILLSKIKVHYVTWKTMIGTGDASSTGISCGGIWSIKGFIVRFISTHMQLKGRPSIEVIPLFQQSYVSTEFSCMVSVQLGQAIYGIIQLLKKGHNHTQTNTSKTAHT